MRPIDADAIVSKWMPYCVGGQTMRLLNEIDNAPTIEPESKPHEFGGFNGDAISRVWLYKKLQANPASFGHPQFAELIRQAPSIPATPAQDVVTAEDVVEGIRWYGPLGCRVSSTDRRIAAVMVGNIEVVMPLEFVADLISGCIRRGETVAWPEGHPRNPKKPTLLEAAERVIAEVPYPKEFHEIVKELKAAIEAERKGEETK